jgi:hypothetical protein
VKTFANIASLVAAAVFVICARAGDSGFMFDASGNLLAEFPANSNALPQIISHPQPQVASPGGLGSFFVVAANTYDLTYQWRFNGTNIANATNDALLLTNVSVTNQGEYSVVLVNSSGSVTSAPAALFIDSDGDGIADSWEFTYFGTLTNNASSDRDGDSVSNGEEFLDDTNPTNSASALFRLTIGSDGGLLTVSPSKLKYTNGEVVTLTAIPTGSEVFHGWTGDALGTNTTVMVTMNRPRSVFAHFSYYSLVFTNTANSDWHNVLNWSPNLVPAIGDTVVLTFNGTVSVNSNAVCAGLILGGSTSLSGSGTVTVHSNGLWASGNMADAGRTIIGSNATFTINNLSGTVLLDTRTLENAGTIVWTGADNHNLQLSGAVITNRPGALFEVRNNANFYPFPGNGRFDNAGTLRKTTGSGTTIFAVNNSFGTIFPFNNYGTTEVQSGTLLCSASFVNNGAVTVSPGATMRISAGGSGSGTFSNATGALVEWIGNSSTFTLSPGAVLSGSGLYRIGGGTVAFNADVAVQNLDLTATLDGSGLLTVNNLLNWISGSMLGSGRTIIAPGATNKINNLSSTVFLGTRTLENAGTILWTGGDAFSLQCSGAVITNRPGALFEVRNNGSFGAFPASSRFDNAGTLRKIIGSGTTTFAVNVNFGTLFPFNNYGTTEIQTGTLLCSAACVNNGTITLSPGTTLRMAGGGSTSGTFINPPSSLVEWIGNSSTFTVSPSALLSGSGLYRIGGGTVAFNADVAVQNLDLAATLDGSGRLTVNNLLNWTAGSMLGSGRTIIAPGATNNINNQSSTVFLGTRTLENAGTIVWTGADNFSLQCSGAVITNRPGALFEVRNNASFGAFPGNGRFDNAGTLRKIIGSGITAFDVNVNFGTLFPFNNYGTLDIQRGIVAARGGYTPGGGALLKCTLGGTNAGSGFSQLQVSGTVNLNGGLNVDLLPGFIPATNSTFTVVTAGARNGAFTSFSYPSNVVAMQLSNSPTSVILRVTAITLTNGPPILAGSLPPFQVFYAGRNFVLPLAVYGEEPFTYQWIKNGTNVVDSMRIVGAQTRTLATTNANRDDSGNYQLLVTNSMGSTQSAVSAVMIQNVPKLNNAGAGWTLQGTTPPPMSSNTVTLTSGLFNTARSVFYNAPLYIEAFRAQFIYRDVGGGGADGTVFCLHNDARGGSALGGAGGGLGYGGISPSAAMIMNIYSPNSVGIAFRTNGSVPGPGGYSPTTPVNIASGNPIHVTMIYTNGMLRTTLVESNTANTFTTNFAWNIPAIVGGQTAYVGFTGSDGGVASTQVISNFTFVPITAVLAEQTPTNTVTLSWPATIGGYSVQMKTNLNVEADTWQNTTNVVNQAGNRNRVNVLPNDGGRYFRLSIDPAE